MNLPNQLTLLRVGLSFVLIFFLLTPGLGAKLAALAVFAGACLTDWWDGRLARRRRLVTDFGILMDPIADKILVLSAFCAFVQLRVAPAWMVVAIAAREFIVTGLRLFALGKGQVLPAEAAGKHKTVSQMVAISVTLVVLIARELALRGAGRGEWVGVGERGIWWLMLLTVVLTLTSGVSFLWRHRKIILNL
ncbi:MAG: CDP-diacylglycerol--glycerol-3-phosphate 3-phosphatidyltransferase [Candidatus Omnitrophica bacterium]|nr:CDP-diacylglycerol--glycerol-3-phosphate 3-phosphatidyltransferase [Candidatus Omnitrophota bacterium]